jgi:hypothetical protein
VAADEETNMRWMGLVSLAAIAIGCARGPNVSTDQLPLQRVVIYRNGVGYFERAGEVDEERVTFRMRQKMVGDFLATLAIVERGGSSVRSASFPLEVQNGDGDEPEPDPRYQSMLKPWPGPNGSKKKKDPAEEMRDVILHLDGKQHDLAIGYVSETPVWRPSYRLVVQDGGADLQAWGIVQNLSGEDWNGISLVLVAGAPLAFESTLGDPVVPARPIVTDTGEVIAAVPGGVTSLAQRGDRGVDRYGADEEPAAPAAEAEYDYDGVEDEEGVAEDRRAGPTGGASGRGQALKKKDKPAPSKAGRAPGAPPAARPMEAPSPDQTVSSRTERRRLALEEARREGLSAPRRMSALAAVAIETGTTRYEIPTPVTVPNESATMVLLLNQRVPGEAVFLFAPDPGVPQSASHPFRVARFKNATKGLLERGPIAVFEKGSFLGQGMVDPLPPGATATVPFALERSLAVERDQKWDQQGARIHKIEAGELWIERDQITKTIYKAKNGGDKPAKLLVRHSRSAGTRLYKPPPGTEENTGQGNALIPISVRGHGRAELTVDERRGYQQQAAWLSPLADEAVKAYLADTRGNPKVQQQLKAAWQLRDTWRRTADELQKLSDEQQELEKAVRETRLSLQAIEKNPQAGDLRVKLTQRLNDITTRMNQITKRTIELKLTANEQEVRFRDAVREVKLLAPPPPKD